MIFVFFYDESLKCGNSVNKPSTYCTYLITYFLIKLLIYWYLIISYFLTCLLTYLLNYLRKTNMKHRTKWTVSVVG